MNTQLTCVLCDAALDETAESDLYFYDGDNLIGPLCDYCHDVEEIESWVVEDFE